MNHKRDIEHKPLVSGAVDHWLRLQADPESPTVQAEVRQWCEQSAAHERAFLSARQTWQLAGQIDALPPIRDQSRRARRGATAGRKRFAVVAMAAAACLALVALPTLTVIWQSDYRTGTGEKRTIRLADGSAVTLDSSSAIAVDMGTKSRGVRLLAGRAWFNVAKSAHRPFTVSAADAHVTVTGTAFDVALEDDTINVSLAHGGVRFDWGGKTATMTPGDRIHVLRHMHAVKRDHAATSSMGSWRRDRLLLENVTLAEGVEQLRRYYTGAIILADTDLARRRVTGVFDVREPDQALRLMVLQHGATIREITPWLLVISEAEK